MKHQVLIIGGGLAGVEASLFLAGQGHAVLLWDMKPSRMSPAHHSPLLSELVCSNSLRSALPSSAVGLLKLEMSLLFSPFMSAAHESAVPAGRALAVDRVKFSELLTDWVSQNPLVDKESREASEIPPSGPTILATGPLTSDALASSLAGLTGSSGLSFYDAIAPIVSRESVDMSSAYWGDRWGDPGVGDYLNCPLTEEEYEVFYNTLLTSPQTPLHSFEDPHFFEGCLPIEVMAARGPQTLTFGPMKPVGLTDPKTGHRPFAVVQLRKEDPEGCFLNLVGFQTKLTHSSQVAVFRLIPALKNAEFVRLGSVHRNTFLDSPRVLDGRLSLRNAPHVLVAGQLSGVEGYVESAAMGLLCGINASRVIRGLDKSMPPPTTALGALVRHLSNTEAKPFQPSNVNFGLFPPLAGKTPKKKRGELYARRALSDLVAWAGSIGLPVRSGMLKDISF